MILLSRLPGAAFPLCNLVASSNLEQLILLSAHILFISAHICYPYNRFDRLLSLLTVCIMTIMLFAVVNQFSVTPISCFWPCQSPSQSLQLFFSIRSSELSWTCFFNVWHHCHFIANNWKTGCASQKWWYSLQDSLHQDSPSMRLWLGPDNLPQILGPKERDSSCSRTTVLKVLSALRQFCGIPTATPRKTSSLKGLRKLAILYLFCWGRLCNVVFPGCLNSLNGDL